MCEVHCFENAPKETGRKSPRMLVSMAVINTTTVIEKEKSAVFYVLNIYE